MPILILDTLIAIPIALRRRLRARLADRPRDHGGHDGGAVDLVPGLRDRRPVRVRLPARLVPGAGLERQHVDQPASSTRRCRCCWRCWSGLSPQTRLYRSFFLDELGHDYVRTARAKGLTEPAVLFRHVLRNALIPILTNVGLALPGILIGSFLIEVFFSIPGIGREVLLAVNRSDYPVIQAVTIYVAMLTMLANLAVDLSYQRGRSAGGAAMTRDAGLRVDVAGVDAGRHRVRAARRRRLALGLAALPARRRGHGVAGDRARLRAADRAAPAAGWWRATGRTRSACPTRRRRSSAPAAPEPPRPRRRRRASAPANVDISDVDPLAPRYKEWDAARRAVPRAGAADRRDAAVRRRPARARRAGQGAQGHADLGVGGRARGHRRHADRRVARRARGLLRRLGRRLRRVGLQRAAPRCPTSCCSSRSRRCSAAASPRWC